MAICDKRTLQPGGEEDPCKDNLVPPGSDPPGGPPDRENPFDPPPPPVAGNCNIDDDCPRGYICVDGVCVPDPKLPGGPNTPIVPPTDPNDPNVGGGGGGGGGGTPPGLPGTPDTPGNPNVPGGGNPSVQAQNGQELWNINDGLQHNSCFLPDKYAKIKWEPRQHVFCRRVDFCDNTQTWGDVFIGDLGQYQDGGEIQEGCSEDRIPKDEQTSGRLFVQHSTTLYDSLSVKEWTYLNCTLDVASDITCAGSLTVDGEVTIDSITYTRELARVQIWDEVQERFVPKRGYILFHDLS